MTAVTITVTQDDIDKGDPQTASSCPISLAMVRAGLSKPWVFETYATIGTGPRRTDVCLPSAACHFISNFDFHGECCVAPFTFDLDVPDDLTGGA
jgi:hypothetical protein